VRQKRPKGLTLAGKRRGTRAWKDPEGRRLQGGQGRQMRLVRRLRRGTGAPMRPRSEGKAANMPVKASLPRTTKKVVYPQPVAENPRGRRQRSELPARAEAQYCTVGSCLSLGVTVKSHQ